MAAGTTMTRDLASASVRIDKWLWAARFFKTRSLAVQAVEGGRVRVDQQRVKPARNLHVRDLVSIERDHERLDVVVCALATHADRRRSHSGCTPKRPKAVNAALAWPRRGGCARTGAVAQGTTHQARRAPAATPDRFGNRRRLDLSSESVSGNGRPRLRPRVGVSAASAAAGACAAGPGCGEPRSTAA